MADTDEYVVRYTITPEAALAAQRLARGRYANFYVAISRYILIVLGLFFMFRGDTTYGLVLTAIGVILLIVSWSGVAQRWFIGHQARSVVGRTQQLTFGETGMRWESSLSRGEIPWTGMTEVREDAQGVIVMRDRMLVAYMPQAALDPPERRTAAVAFIRRRIAESAPGLTGAGHSPTTEDPGG